jgi:multidrug efflux pump subunit AcrA (membrane-fusion protein)
MNKRKFSIVSGLLVVVASYFLFKYLASQKEPEKRIPSVTDVKLVKVKKVENKDIASQIYVTGKLVAKDKIDIYAEVGGLLLPNRKEFKEGVFFQEGEVMLRLDEEEARLNLLAQKSNVLNLVTQILPDIKIDYKESAGDWLAYVENFDLESPLPPLPQPRNVQEKFFFASRNVYNYYYTIKSQEARLEKYVIRAPFSGIVTESAINPGTLVRTGQKLGELINTQSYEMEISVSLRDAGFVQIGDIVTLASVDVAGEWKGRVVRISDKIDPNTQTLKAFLLVSGKGLKEGMYLSGQLNTRRVSNAVEIPRKLLINEGEIYVVSDSVLALHSVEVVRFNEETAIITGLTDGVEIVDELLVGAYRGMKVKKYQ